ncbi:MAG: hypothetical protein DRP47_06870 [Candidatus Zixiibacteriota bacterium]|nr:MAG: hypothetical protein DRP47_06870 [candidate division Zixibacteria bacterium]
MTSLSKDSVKPIAFAALAYIATLVLYLVVSFMPDGRVWGLNWWGYYPSWVAGILFAAGISVGAFIWVVARRDYLLGREEPGTGTSRCWWLLSAGVVLTGIILFVLLRGQTHFLGDGYGLLAMLGQDMASYHQMREHGESLAHLLVRDAIGTGGKDGALLAYQVLSVFSGAVFLVTVASISKRLFEGVAARVLFVLGLATGGYMLLFFGYVENYSLFLSSVAIYCLLGLLITMGELPRWLIILSLTLSIFFHVMGVVLIPSALYLLLHNSKLGARICSHRTTIKVVIAVALIATAITFYYFYSTYYFFRFAIIPIVPDQFTVEGYTMFSINHIVDYLNLVIVLFPGSIVALVTLIVLRPKRVHKRGGIVFLLILTASSLAAAFVFDPKLGMPRDWDLFAFAGVPLVALTMFILLADGLCTKTSMAIVMLAISLNLVVLGPRVVSQVIPDVSLAHFKNYITLDQMKNRYVSMILKNYYLAYGDTVRAEEVAAIWNERYPEIEMLHTATALKQSRKYKEAITTYYQILDRDPFHFDSYNNLAECYLQLRQYDSALSHLEVSIGLSPYNPAVWNNIASAYFYKKEYDQAERAWFKSLEYDSTNIEPIVGLASLYYETGQNEKYFRYLIKAATRPNAPGGIFVSLGDYFMERADYQRTAAAYREAAKRGVPENVLGKRWQHLKELSP